MKPKKTPKSLTLSKTTVANLNKTDLDHVKGGTWLDTKFYGCPPDTRHDCTFTAIQEYSYCLHCIIPG